MLEPLECVFAQGGQHPVALAVVSHQTAVDERLQRVPVRAADGFGGGERAPAREYPQAREQPALCGVDEFVAPIEGGSEGLLAAGRVAGAAGQQRQARVQTRQDLAGARQAPGSRPGVAYSVQSRCC